MAEKNLHPNTVKIQLDTEFTVSGVKVPHLIMRRPKVRDRVAASKASTHEADQMCWLIASLCEIEISDLMEMDDLDFAKLEAQIQAFRTARP